MKSINSYKVFILLSFVCNSSILGTVSARVFKRDANSDTYPDWLPFKNKTGEDLGETSEVKPKTKPIKRLALPANFILKAVAEPDSDDYYDKAESDGEDYFDKKDWSDTNRQADLAHPIINLNHTNLSEIDGIVNIITEQLYPKSSVAKKQNRRSESEEDISAEEKEEREDLSPLNNNSTEKEKKVRKKDNSNEETRSEELKENKKQEDDVEYEDGSAEKQKSELSDEENRENEAKKARILASVDALKARHAQEQRFISETVKEEEMYNEEFERDKIKSSERNDKYGAHPIRIGDYNDYDEESLNDKYEVNHRKPKKTTNRIIPKRLTTQTPKPHKVEKHIESGKLSVFKNPRAYMIYDDDDSEEQPKKKTKPAIPTRITTSKPKPTKRYSAKFSTPPTNSNEDNVRISLVPEDDETKEGEPAMFFPKIRVNKRKRKQYTTAPATEDSSLSEFIADKTAADLTTALDANTSQSKESAPSAIESAASVIDSASSEMEIAPSVLASALSDSVISAEETSPIADDTGPSALDSDTAAAQAPSAVDVITASSDKNEHKKDENSHHEKGGDKEHHSEHESSHEEHGEKAYEGISKDTKTEKGYHDKEDHLGKYKDHGGIDKHHEDEKKHFGEHHHEERGKKHAEYEESGKHSKGHSTKGSHDIHKVDEFEKKVEFFEEEGDSSEEEKHGGHNHERSHSSGGKFKKGDLNAAYNGNTKGDSARFKKGGHGDGHKGYRGSAGRDSHAKHGSDHHTQGGNASGKTWIYHHGYPAKTSNLVAIDRRGDTHFRGPHYYK